MNKIFFGWTCTDLRDFKSSKGGHLDPGRHLFPRIELRDDDDGTCQDFQKTEQWLASRGPSIATLRDNSYRSITHA